MNNDKTYRILSYKVKEHCFNPDNRDTELIDKVNKDISLEEIVNIYYNQNKKYFSKIKTLNSDFIII